MDCFLFCLFKISAAWKNQKVPYAGSVQAIKKGVYIKGTINILGFAPGVEILLSDEVTSLKFVNFISLRLLSACSSLEIRKGARGQMLQTRRNWEEI